MTCCAVNIIPFAFESVTTIPWTGDRPTVSVIYIQDDNTFLQMGVFTQVNQTPTDIIITHGGLASGYVKIMQ